MGAERPGLPRSAALLAAAIVAAVACDEPTIPVEARSARDLAYDPRLLVRGAGAGGADTLIVYHWPRGRTISVYVEPGATSNGVSLERALASAFDAWEQAVYFRELSFRRADSPSDADVVVHDIAAPIADLTGCEGLGAFGGLTAFCASQALDSILPIPLLSGAPSRVKFDVTIDGTSVPDTSLIRAVVAHELGHAVGIGAHSPQSTDVMSATPSVAAPSPEDARALRWLLQQPADMRP